PSQDLVRLRKLKDPRLCLLNTSSSAGILVDSTQMRTRNLNSSFSQFRLFAAMPNNFRTRAEVHVAWRTTCDPNVWSGRALQEVFVDPVVAVSHQCIRPLIGACCAPGHHGYQRACDLISG